MAKKGLGKGLEAIFGADGKDAPGRSFYKKRADGSTETNVLAADAAEMISDQKEDLQKESVQQKKTASLSETSEKKEKKRKEEEILQQVRISLIQPNLAQPRKKFDETELQELADSIKTFGILQPLLLKKQGSLYEIIAGERRWRAAKLAGLKEVPALIKEMDLRKSREVSIIENIQRADLNAVEEAMAYQSLITEYGMTQEELAQRVSKKRSTITNCLRLLKLDPEILDMLREGSITQGHARALLSVEDRTLRLKIAEKCRKENLSVREIETIVRLDQLSRSHKGKAGTEEAAEMKRLKLIYRDLEKKMKSKLGTKVSIVPKDKNKGILEIEYYSQDELDRIFMMLNSISKDV